MSGILGGVVNPTCDQTKSDVMEPDDFVQRQLLLSTALCSYFGVSDADCRTFFRDDHLGLGLFVARDGKPMQALCRRPDRRAPWQLISLRPAPRWTPYPNEDSDLGVQVSASEIDQRKRHPVRHALIDGIVYTIDWDVHGPATSER
ncbi:MAG: hypothetical protein M3450_02440 [Actinomycetota bacterium]|nr:hypothetical protein [Actinomycetota bacterium]